MPSEDDAPSALRVMTWNVRDLRGDPLAVHRVLRSAHADVVCLQEAPRTWLSRNRIADLARRAGMLYVTGGRASGGTALLARVRADVSRPSAVRLPVAGRFTRPRGAVSAVVALPGTRPVLVVGVHLGLDDAERADHVARVLEHVRSVGLPAVVAGDLNEPPGGPSWQALGAVVADPAADDGLPTFPARRPRHRIDVVLVDPVLDVLGHGSPDGVDPGDVLLASDHLPVAATVRLPR